MAQDDKQSKSIDEVLEQTEALKLKMATADSPIEQLGLFMDTLKDSITALSLADLKGAEESIRQLTLISSNDLFRGIGEVTRELHDSLRDIQKFINPILAIYADDQAEGISSRLDYVSSLVKESSEKTLDLLFNRQEKVMDDQIALDRAEKLLLEGDVQGAIERIRRVKEHNGELVKELTRISEMQIHADLVDQIIKKVSRVVGDLEKRLVALVRRYGREVPRTKPVKPVRTGEVMHGPVVPGLADEGAATRQDDVDSLLASLGL